MRSMFLGLVLSVFAVSTAVGCAATPAEDDAVAGQDAMSATDRAGIMDGLRAKVKPTLANQDIVFNVSGASGVIRQQGDYAWLQGMVQLRSGGEPTTRGTQYEETDKEGLFDGFRIEALLKRAGNGWSVVEYGLGTTDVWYDSIDERYPAASKSIFPWRDSSPNLEQVSPSERMSIMNALRAKQEGSFGGQQIVYNVAGGSFRVSGDWCWLKGKIELRGGGEPKYIGDFKDSEDMMDGWHVEALFQKVNGRWTVVAEGIGSTDVWWDGIWDSHPAAPRSIFPELDNR